MLATVLFGTHTLLKYHGAVCEFYLPENMIKMIQLGEITSIYLCCKIILEVVILCYCTVIFCFFMSEWYHILPECFECLLFPWGTLFICLASGLSQHF